MKDFFIRRYKELEPSFDVSRCTMRPSLRINTLKISHKEILSRLKKERVKLEKVKGLEDAYHYEAPFSMGATPEYLQGYYYLQETASQHVAEMISPKDGDVVLDMCASPGSKTTHLAQLMSNKGIVIALEKKKTRIPSLKNNLERMGVKNTIIYNMDAREASRLGKKFDRIILDAPCSGNFMIDEGWFEKRDLEDIRKNARTQKQLVSEAVKCLKDDGTLLYSTCSLEPEENEEVVDWAKDELELKEVKRKRFWPHIDNTQGFFISILKK